MKSQNIIEQYDKKYIEYLETMIDDLSSQVSKLRVLAFFGTVFAGASTAFLIIALR